jgi:hypothetical protein
MSSMIKLTMIEDMVQEPPETEYQIRKWNKETKEKYDCSRINFNPLSSEIKVTFPTFKKP